MEIDGFDSDVSDPEIPRCKCSLQLSLLFADLVAASLKAGQLVFLISQWRSNLHEAQRHKSYPRIWAMQGQGPLASWPQIPAAGEHLYNGQFWNGYPTASCDFQWDFSDPNLEITIKNIQTTFTRDLISSTGSYPPVNSHMDHPPEITYRSFSERNVHGFLYQYDENAWKCGCLGTLPCNQHWIFSWVPPNYESQRTDCGCLGSEVPTLWSWNMTKRNHGIWEYPNVTPLTLDLKAWAGLENNV